MNTRQIGDNQENLALNYLEQNGYKLIKKNFHYSKFAEIDLIVYQPILKLLVFVEVKSGYYNFEEIKRKVNKKKQKQIIKAATYFLTTYHGFYNECRFDVIITDNKNNLIKEHLENAFYDNF